MVGVAGFEPTTSSSRTKRASQAALYPDTDGKLRVDLLDRHENQEGVNAPDLREVRFGIHRIICSINVPLIAGTMSTLLDLDWKGFVYYSGPGYFLDPSCAVALAWPFLFPTQPTLYLAWQ